MIEEVCIGKGRKQYEVYDINLISLQFHVVTWKSVVRRVCAIRYIPMLFPRKHVAGSIVRDNRHCRFRCMQFDAAMAELQNYSQY